MEQAPVVAQPAPVQLPGQMVMMQLPPLVPNCPPGLEYLSVLDQVLINQEVHLLEVLTDFECKNKFRILNNMGQQVYFAGEESSILMRLCCGSERGFVFHIVDNMNQDVLRVRRDLRCCTGCYCLPCKTCRYFASIEDRNGRILGYISNLRFCCSPRFALYDENKSIVAKFKGPCCPWQAICCTDDLDYKVISVPDGTQIGTMSKVWPGALKDMCTKADNFRLTFPSDLDVKTKALMLASIFVIDMVLYENNDDC